MKILDEYPKTFRYVTKEVRDVLSRVPGIAPHESDEIARAINDIADKACDLNDIFQRMLEPTTAEELADLLIAFELTVEQLQGNTETIDGKLYDIADRLKGEAPATQEE